MHDRYSDTLDHPRTLLPTTEQTDFSRNLYELEKRARRPYSLTSVLRAMCETPHKLGALEMEVDQELRALNPRRGVIGHLVPIEALSQPWRRDLTITTPSTGSVTVQTSVGDEVIPFLRAKTVCGRLGATLLDGLTNGNVKLPRAILGTTASWLPEIGGGADADPNFDSFTATPKRIQGSTVFSRQLVYQSSVDIEAFIANDIANAIAVAVDNAALNGTGTAPQPLGILNYPANPAFSYTYSSRSPNVTFGGPASWANVLLFEKNVELSNVVNDGTFGYAVDPATRDKWQQTTKTTGATAYPVYLWENTADPADPFGRVNGRRSISSTQIQGSKVIFGKWSECMICTWLGLDVHVDPFTLATTGEIRVQVSLLCDIQFRYPIAFSVSTDSGAQ
jgi:HK97 family phage major capsid protein